MAAPADAGSLRHVSASVPSPVSADPCARPATHLSTRFENASSRSRLFSVPLLRVSFAFLQFRLSDVFARLSKKSSLRQTQSARHLSSRQQQSMSRSRYNQGKWDSSAILFAVDTFQTLVTRDSFGPMVARLMSTHLLAG